jgi:hypothetical protein
MVILLNKQIYTKHKREAYLQKNMSAFIKNCIFIPQ